MTATGQQLTEGGASPDRSNRRDLNGHWRHYERRRVPPCRRFGSMRRARDGRA